MAFLTPPPEEFRQSEAEKSRGNPHRHVWACAYRRWRYREPRPVKRCEACIWNAGFAEGTRYGQSVVWYPGVSTGL